MKDKKYILPVHEPLITHLPQNTIIFTVLGETKGQYEWLMNNFVNIRINKHWDYDDFYRRDMWHNCYYIQDNAFCRDFFFDVVKTDIVEFLINTISNGYYANISLNMKCINAYQFSEDMAHMPLIYGYDIEKEEIYLADFFVHGKFSFGKATFEEIRKAYCYNPVDYDWYPFKLQRYFKIKKNYEYEFDFGNLIEKLKDYYESKKLDTGGYFQFQTNDMEEKLYFKDFPAYDTNYGIACYDVAIELAQTGELWVKFLHLLYCHKVIMKKRIEFLINKYQSNKLLLFLEECDKIILDSLVCRNSLIKNSYQETTIKNVRSNKNSNLACKLSDLKEKDKKFTANFILHLEELMASERE